MKDIFGLFDIEVIKEELYNCLITALKKFSLTEENDEVIAIALTCAVSNGGRVWLVYNNKKQLKASAEWYAEHDKETYNDDDFGDLDIYGFCGLEYSVGDFHNVVSPNDERQVYNSDVYNNFHNIYYLITCGTWYGESDPKREFKTTDGKFCIEVTTGRFADGSPCFEIDFNNYPDYYKRIRCPYHDMYNEIILDVALRIKENLDFINKAENFIFFIYEDEEQSDEGVERYMLKTVDKELFEKLFHDRKEQRQKINEVWQARLARK
ncbi:MAG: hypothetical protein FWG90_12965 [Oscillospiraceae bacterium]|nr:hypothetical protein [Oscillospiraceae bacterium]